MSPAKTVKFLTRSETQSLLAAARGHGAREYAMILLAYRHGLRASEVCGLKSSDIDLSGRHILCRRGKGSVTNWQHLPEDELVALQSWLNGDRGTEHLYAFPNGRGGHLSRQHFFRLFRKIASAAGITPDKRHPHVLKHALGTHLANAGVPLQVIQQRLGHRSINSTMVYLAIASEYVDRTVARAIEAGTVV